MTTFRHIIASVAGLLFAGITAGCAFPGIGANTSAEATPTVHPILALNVTVVPYRSGAMEPNELTGVSVTATPSLFDQLVDAVSPDDPIASAGLQEITATPDPFYASTAGIPSASPVGTATASGTQLPLASPSATLVGATAVVGEPVNGEGTPTDAATSLPATQQPVASATPFEPTRRPRPSVTPQPTRIPTQVPTATPRPTSVPLPTHTPAPSSTPEPTNTPLPSDTPVPTNTPEPTATNTPRPTRTPRPTAVPTNTPTTVPTDVPTNVPTDVPTDVPTNTPTPAPTDVPTDVPTTAPTSTP